MTAVGTAALVRRIEALEEAAERLERHVPGPAVDAASAVVERARGRMRHGTDHTVVALAGQTGSGKSSLLNAIVGRDVCPVGVRRPTTAHARAVVCGGDGEVGPLLDWLQVRHRHEVDADPTLAGLVLLDLPDVDSVATAHHLEAHRLIERVDLLVFVTDPQKYADQALHDGELARLAGHAEVVEVVLSQVDRLSDVERTACLRDLRRRLADDGLGEVDPRPASAVTGEGVDRLRDRAGRAVRDRRAMLDRLAADLAAAATRLDPGGPDGHAPDGLPRRARREAVHGLARAVGVEGIADVVVAQYRHDARLATGWPPTRWVARWRRAPVSSVPAVSRSRVAGDQVRATLRDLGEALGDGLADPWDRRVRDVARGQQAGVLEGLAGVTTRDVEALRTRPAWWRAVNVLQVALLLAAVAGGLWLVVLAVAGSALLVDTADWAPRWRGLPVPTWLLLGGLGVGLVLAGLCRLVVRLGARRRARRARRRLAAAIEDVVDDRVAPAVTGVLADRHRARDLLATAAGHPPSPGRR